VTGNFDGRVAVLTIDLVIARVKFVREGNWLFRLVALIVTNYDFVIREGPDEDAKSRNQANNDNRTDDLFCHELEPSVMTFKVDVQPFKMFSVSF
jgi:hypothetical protein